MKKRTILLLVVAFVATLSGISYVSYASDHDDGETDTKSRNTNLTDLYVFREDWQNTSGSANNLVLIMNTNPRSLARQQYFFATTAQYAFHFNRIAAANKALQNTAPSDDVQLTFNFAAPDTNNHQAMTIALTKDGSTYTATSTTAGTPIITSTLLESQAATTSSNTMNINTVSLGGSNITVFAGLREDPFFFDVERYFRIRDFAVNSVNTLDGTPIQGAPNYFKTNATAVDFAAGYNVNAIAVTLPIALLQSSAAEPSFGVWETISISQ
jgi:hypothetical protein